MVTKANGNRVLAIPQPSHGQQPTPGGGELVEQQLLQQALIEAQAQALSQENQQLIAQSGSLALATDQGGMTQDIWQHAVMAHMTGVTLTNKIKVTIRKYAREDS